MKAIIKYSLLLLAVPALLFSSCVKDEAEPVVDPTKGPSVLNTTISTLVLVQANANNTAGSFTWTATNFGYKAAVTYTLQFSRAGTNFGNVAELNVGASLSRSFTVRDLNAKLLDIIPFGVPTAVQARVKADVGSGVTPVYSNPVNMTITAYLDVVNYEFPNALRLAGNFQGWDPGSAPKIVDKAASGTTGSGYEGYINFNNASPEFKMVKGNNWGAGDFGSNGAGILGNGGPNLTLSGGAGVYLIRANTNAMTWSNTKITTWGIIGDATPGGWGGSTPMTFNAGDGSWSITANLGTGEMKFRANNDWAINFGDNHNPPGVVRDNKPEYDGNNIPITAAGNYTITLSIGLAGNYSYTIRRN